MKSTVSKVGVLCLASVLLLTFALSCAATPDSAAPSALEVTDHLGRTVKLEGTPQRIVSLAPSNTEIVYALGLADRLVAVTDYCDYPPEAKEKPSIGGFSTPNIEEIIAQEPDLILATSIHEDKVLPQLEDKGMTVLVLHPKTVALVLEAIKLVGRVSGVEDNAETLVDAMEQRIKAVTDRTEGLAPEQRPPTFYVVWHDPLMTAGSGTLQNELIAMAGGVNIAQNTEDYAEISLEAVVAANPAVIIAATSHGSMEEQNYLYVREESRLRDTKAHQTDRVHAIDGNLTSRPGPRIVDGLEGLARLIHPELFP